MTTEQQLVNQLLQRIREGYYEIEWSHRTVTPSMTDRPFVQHSLTFEKDGKNIFSANKHSMQELYTAYPSVLNRYAEQLYKAGLVAHSPQPIGQNTEEVLRTILDVQEPEPDNKLEQVENFMEEILAVCNKYNLVISHEDTGGSFLIRDMDDDDYEWLSEAYYKP